jgi:hypothetical protein
MVAGVSNGSMVEKGGAMSVDVSGENQTSENQTRENLTILQNLANKPAAREWFSQVLSYLRVRVSDTGEEFTVITKGDEVEITPGFVPPQRRKLLYGLFDPGEWYAKQFIVTVSSQNVRNFSSFFDDDIVSEEELFRIMSFLMPVLLKATLEMSAMRNRLLVNTLRLDTMWHQCLLDPQGNETQQATVQMVGNTWEVLPGYHGTPQRKKVLTPEKLLEFQRRVHKAEEEDTLNGWFALLDWYRQWLASVSAPLNVKA